MVSHTFGYSKSTRAKCHGPPPCKGTSLPPGTLRYGRLVTNEYGSENVEWRHWGCVTPAILAEISGVETIPGFSGLKSQDQQRIRRAIAVRHVDPADVPASAGKPELPKLSAAPPVQTPTRGVAMSQVSASTHQNKRKAQDDRPSASGSHTPSEVIEIGDEDDNTPEEEAKDELYCALRTDVVGLQYYRGLVGTGEQVLLLRQPDNQYDRNAIQVQNIGRQQIGHVPRNVAAKLAPLMDRKLVTVEGVVHDGNLSGSGRKSLYKLSMTVNIYGPSDKRNVLEPLLVWATPGQRGFPHTTGASSSQAPRSGIPASQAMPPPPRIAGSSRMTAAQIAQQEAAQKQREQEYQKANELRDMLKTLEKKDDEERRSSLLDTVCSVEDVLSLPEYPSPPGIQAGNLKVDLLKHQKQGLKWCVDREYPKLPTKETDKPVQFWQLKAKPDGQKYYFNMATKTPQATAPPLGRGAVVADAMGLGKTLTMLALILATKSDVPANISNATLVVVPLSVLSNWEKQIQDHFVKGSLTFCIYYGNNRSQLSASDLAKYDVVFTTYQTVTGEHADDVNGNAKKKKKMERALFEVKWKRVILDEGHTIRNPKTKMTKAACALPAERRWVITGTPIINTVRDLGSILTFLRICSPLDNPDFFNRLLLRPLKNGDVTGVQLLRALMNEICIRRTKEMKDSTGNPLVPLPPVDMTLVPVALSEEARTLYERVADLSSERFQNLLKTNNRALIQSNALALLTRLRQLALHPGLLPPNYLEQLGDNDTPEAEAPTITPEIKEKLQDRLAQFIEDCEECSICLGLPTDPKITRCFHVYCCECIQQALAKDPRCPMDRRSLSINNLVDPRPPHELTQFHTDTNAEENTSTMPSAKIEHLIKLLNHTPGGEKSLVFSQFTSFLDKIAQALDEAGIPYVRFDGQMSAQKRQAAIARFSVPLQQDKRPQASQASSVSQTSRARKASKRIVIDEEDGEGGDDGDDYIAGSDSDFDIDNDKTKSRGKAKGKGNQKNVTAFDLEDDDDFGFISSSSQENPAVMLISLKAGALGLNLTVANNVFLMDPWWQEGIESQAIDRVNRIGQTKPVHVYQLISENTVEAKVLEIQDRKKKLIAEAFAGKGQAQTVTQKREARMQELTELLGSRRQQAQA